MSPTTKPRGRPRIGPQRDLWVTPETAKLIAELREHRGCTTSEAVAEIVVSVSDLEPPTEETGSYERVPVRLRDAEVAAIKRWPGRNFAERFRELAKYAIENREFPRFDVDTR